MASRLLAARKQSFTCLVTSSIQNQPCVDLWLERNKEKFKMQDIEFTTSSYKADNGGFWSLFKKNPRRPFNVDFNICVDRETEDLFFVPSKTALNLEEDYYQVMFTLKDCGENKEVEDVVLWLKDSMDVFLKTSRIFIIDPKVSEFVSQNKKDIEEMVDEHILEISHKLDDLNDVQMKKVIKALEMENVILHGTSMMIKLPPAFLGAPEKSKVIDDMQEAFQELPRFLEALEDEIIQDAIIQATEGNKLLKLKLLLYIAKTKVQNFQLMVTKEKQTALHLCKSKEALLVLRKYIKGKDVLNSFNYENITPIYKAFNELNYDCAALLLKLGADTSLSTKKSLWDIAVEAYVQDKPQGMDFITLLYNKGVFMGSVPVKTLIQNLKLDQRSVQEQGGVDLKSLFLDAVTNSQYNDVKVICMLHIQQFVDGMLQGKQVLDLDAYRAAIVGHASKDFEKMAKVKQQLFAEFDEDGDTSLHIAVKKNDGRMVDLLLALGADRTTKNIEGKEAFPSVGVNERNIEKSAANHPRVLCLDGGGMRGLIEIHMLKKLEEITGKQIRDLFDFIAGTSTGAILTAILTQGKLTLDEVENFYLDMGGDIFKGWWPYKSASLIKHAKAVFGEDTCLKELGGEDKEIFICAVNPSDGEFLKMITKENCPHYPVWKAVVASASAPKYFEPFYDNENDTSYLDGGLAANNPTLEVIAYLENKNMQPKCVLSLGTGHYREGSLFDKDDFYLGQGWGAASFMMHISNVKHLLSLLVNTATNAYGLTSLMAQRICKALNVPFLHLDPHLDRNIDLDTTTEVDIAAMKKLANDLVLANVQELEKFKEHLLE